MKNVRVPMRAGCGPRHGIECMNMTALLCKSANNGTRIANVAASLDVRLLGLAVVRHLVATELAIVSQTIADGHPYAPEGWNRNAARSTAKNIHFYRQPMKGTIVLVDGLRKSNKGTSYKINIRKRLLGSKVQLPEAGKVRKPTNILIK